jgi:hypothetical protein
MFRAVCRSSSGALTIFAASGLHTSVVTGRSHVTKIHSVRAELFHAEGWADKTKLRDAF